MGKVTIISIPHTSTQAVVRVEVERELSGVHWCRRFARSHSIETLQPEFQQSVKGFLHALENAGAKYLISNTYRPKEACYLMSFAWRIWQGKIDPADVVEMRGVNIEWGHGTKEASVNAAYQMCLGYKITKLDDAPALESNHTKGHAIDVSIFWDGLLDIKDADGHNVVVSSLPRDNMNRDLWKVGKSYGVIRYHRPEKDIPHWSIDGY